MDKLNGILLVDDDQVSNYINIRLIERLKIAKKITVALNGIHALQTITSFSSKENICPELIILELEMPIMDGLEFLKEYENLQFDNKDEVKIVALSATINPNYEDALKYFKVECYIRKPLTEERFKNIMRSFACESHYS